MNDQLLKKLSNNFKNSLKAGADLAIELNQKSINPEHIFYGLITQKGSISSGILAGSNKLPAIINLIRQNPNDDTLPDNELPDFSAASQNIIQRAVQIAYLNGHKYIGSEHLLAALLKNKTALIRKILIILNLSEAKLSEQITTVLKSANKISELTDTFKKYDDDLEPEELDEEERRQTSEESLLDVFGNNLTSAKFQKKVDPVIGREKEIERIIQILSRRTKNNPIILGDPGVGKTAIVEGLAKKIMAGEVPEILLNKKIYALDLTALVAGTIYRGEFENRLKQVVDEVRKRPDIILFIDEIHGLVGAGSASGSMDAANILKPYLARGEIRCIGATTYQDFRKSIENDPALERRFQPVKIAEPTAEEAKKILMGVKPYFENFHRVKIAETAVDSAISLSQKYLPEKFLPDKAIDLIDEAAAAVKTKTGLSPLEQEVKKIEQNLDQLKNNLDELVLKEDFPSALLARDKIKQIQEQLLAAKILKQKEKNKFIGEIKDKDIAKIIARITGVDDKNILISEEKKILSLEESLEGQIVGQKAALEQIVNSIKRAKAGLTPENRPLASFLFIGASGVGKTLTAKILAKEIFNDDKALIKIDMSEYSEKFNISKLIGAPAGYVGYKESGQLTEKIKHRPYSLVLFDEVEKANREIFDLLLQVLDDGFLTDASGSRINFQNTIIIMTSNIGSRFFQDNITIGFGDENFNADNEQKIIKETRDYFRPELLNRLDKIVYFQPLTVKELKQISELELAKLKKRLKNKNFDLKYNDKVLEKITEEALKQRQGARAIRKIIQELVETPLSHHLLSTSRGKRKILSLTIKNGIIMTEARVLGN